VNVRRFVVIVLGAALCSASAVWAGPDDAPPQSAPVLENAVEAPPSGILIKDSARHIEFRLPAGYWEYYDPEALAAQAKGGCSGPRVSPDLVFVLNHKDAPANVWCEFGARSFLMRDENDLEAYVDAFKEAIRTQTGEVLEDVSESYEPGEGMILHRFGFTAPLQARGGCGAPPPVEDAPRMSHLLVHYFIRPAGSDAMALKLFCAAPEDVFADLEREFDFIAESVRYSGELADAFFVPDAPEDKVLSPKAATKAAGAGGRGFNWLLPVALIVIIWLMIRRRKQAAK